jgi:general secretion pathway protein J
MHRQSGLTLVELLVTLTLLGLISTMLFGALRVGTRISDVAARSQESQTEMESVHRFLRRMLSQAQPLEVPRSGERSAPIFEGRILSQAQPLETPRGGERSAPVFEGRVDALSFVAPLPRYLPQGGQSLLAISRSEIEGRAALIADWTPFYPRRAKDAAPTHRRVVLIERVGAIEFNYFGATDGAGVPQWFDRWIDMPHLPLLVRLRVTLADGRRWPDLMVAPRLSASGENEE